MKKYSINWATKVAQRWTERALKRFENEKGISGRKYYKHLKEVAANKGYWIENGAIWCYDVVTTYSNGQRKKKLIRLPLR